MRWRAHAGAVHWHQDGDGTKRTERWLALWYLRGSASLAFWRAAEHSCAVTLHCAPGTLVVFDNTALEHAVESDAPRAFLGPWPVWPEAGPAPSPATPRGGDLCCPTGVETCCGHRCDKCRAREEWDEEKRRAPFSLLHASPTCAGARPRRG